METITGRHGCFRIHEGDSFIGRSLKLYGEWSPGEVELFRALVTPDSVVIEVGANIGALTVPLAQMAGYVFALEPHPDHAGMLRRNIDSNALLNVVISECAAGDVPATAWMPALDAIPNRNYGIASIGDGSINVSVLPLDELWTGWRFRAMLAQDRLDLIKIDVEGFEREVLLGARGIIEKYHPALSLECDRPGKAGPLMALLKELGYRVYRHEPPLYEPDNFAGNPDNVFGAIVSKNWLCLHESDTRELPELRHPLRRLHALRQPALVPPADPAAEAAARARLDRARSRCVMIAMPIGEKPWPQTMISYGDTLVHLKETGIAFQCQFVLGSSNLAGARNRLAAQFLASPCTDLLFIDDDVSWTPAAVVRLLASEQPLICGAYRKKEPVVDSDPQAWPVRFLPDARERLHQDAMGSIAMEFVPTGFMKIERRVFETMAAAHPEWKRRGPPELPDAVRAHYHAFFRFDTETEEISEDFQFCRRWRELGGDVYLDPTIVLTHMGVIAWTASITEIMQAEPDALLQEAAE